MTGVLVAGVVLVLIVVACVYLAPPLNDGWDLEVDLGPDETDEQVALDRMGEAPW